MSTNNAQSQQNQQNNNQQQAAGNEGQGQQQAGAMPETLEALIDSLPEAQKAHASKLLEARVANFNQTAKDIRKERDDFERQARDLAKKAEKGSELETSLNKMADDLAKQTQRADFYESAPPECLNPKAAFAIMIASDLTTRSGQPDWKAIQEAAPQLFGKPGAKGNAGSGTGNQQQPAKETISNAIRRTAGFKTNE